MPRPVTDASVGTPVDSQWMYIRMAFISAESHAKGLPFIDLRKQSLIRSCSESMAPPRARNSGNTPHSPTKGPASATVPAPKWQLEQLRPLPTLRRRRFFVHVDRGSHRILRA